MLYLVSVSIPNIFEFCLRFYHEIKLTLTQVTPEQILHCVICTVDFVKRQNDRFDNTMRRHWC